MQKKPDEEQYFQSADKDCSMQMISFIPNNYQQSKWKNLKRSEQMLWKFETISKYQSPHKKNSIQNQNIQFQEELSSDEFQEVDSDENQPQYSPLNLHYKAFQQVYKKNIGFGTNWIGRKQYYSSVFVDPLKIAKNQLQYYHPEQAFTDLEIKTNKMCVFDSDFESGNLFTAYKVTTILINLLQIGQYEYDLILQNDINTKGNTQWFYFRITNPPKKQNIKINIVNLRKSDSLFNYGMMPCIFSNESQKRNQQGWIRKGLNIKYFKNEHQIENSKRYFYTLTFTISTLFDNDVLRVAHCYPYTVSDLNLYLQNLQKIKYKKEMCERQTLVETLGRNKVQVLTIKQQNSRIKSNRPLIVIMARQHPGETPASFMCEGLIDYLLSKEKDSEYLRKNYEIKIIPMINPDGVAAGNYRTNLYGFDLNRRWDGGARSKVQHEVCYIKKYLTQLIKGRQLAIILDLHGHSRKMYSFFYGNPYQSSACEVRIFPLLCSKLAPNCIRFEDSTFNNQEDKRTTARVQFHLSFKIPCIYTFQTSFFGYINKDKEKKHFTIDGYKQLGLILGKAIYLHERGKQNIQSKEALLYKKCMNQLKNNLTLIKLGEKINSGSESSPEECELADKQEKKLEGNEDYNKDLRNLQNNVKIVKKIMRRELLVKETYKSSRQMQVLDMAKVNSIFPNDVIALIPSSFYAKKKIDLKTIGIQTENQPIVKIYEMCKEQELKITINSEILDQLLVKSKIFDNKNMNNSNLFKNNLNIRPQSTSMEGHIGQISGFPMSRKKSRTDQRKPRIQTGHDLINRKKNYASKEVQTLISLGNKANQQKLRMLDEDEPMDEALFHSTYSTIQHQKIKQQYRSIGKTISKQMMDNIKIRKKSVL